MVRSLASWLWLLDFRDRGTALDASDDATGELSAALSVHFQHVHALRESQLQLDELRISNERQGWTPTSVQVGSAATAPWSAETFDCVVLYDALTRRAAGAAGMADEVARWRPLMRRDAWLVVAAPTPQTFGRGKARAAGIARRSLTRMVKGAGFHDIRCLWVEYSLERPLFLIPDARATVEAYETHDAMRSGGSRARHVAAKSGLSSLLYPGYLLFARA